MRSAGRVGRIAAIAAVVGAIVIVAVLLFSGGGYTVKARFINAAQLVKGNLVQVSGSQVGTIDDIQLTADGQAEVTMSVDKPFAPLRRGTHAVIRQASLSGIANRYVDLQLPPGDARSTGTLPSGSTIDLNSTSTAVDLDQVFNTFDPVARVALQDFFKNSAAQFHGKEAQQQLAYHYLNPALSSGSRLFSELDRDKPLLNRFLVDSATLVSTVAQKRDDLSALIQNLNQTFGALASEKAALAESIMRLPGFMRQANTTFVNLRAALGDVDPLVNASKPVAPKLVKLLAQLRPLARNARPTVSDLAGIVCRSNSCPTGPPQNDLYHLERTLPALASAALDTKSRSTDQGGGPVSVGTVRGAFPEIAQATRDSAPTVGFGRPYTPDLLGWFDDFSTTGGSDAEGAYSRVQNVLNAFNLAPTVPALIPLTDRVAAETKLARTGQYKRCPGAAEDFAADGSNVLSQADQQALDCTESARATGNIR
ncbi:MAG: hypothetical protein NVS2B6_16030 [Thermoleophilaceae bacterium]